MSEKSHTHCSAGTAKVPEIPDDDSDFTPDLARKIIAKYQAIIAMRNSEIDELRRLIDEPQALRETLEKARDFLDPDRGPPWLSNREMVEQINAALAMTRSQCK